MAGAVSKEIDRLRLLVEACTCNVCYAQPVSVEACTNMYTHIHTNMHIMCTDSTTKNIHHIINCDHSPRSYNIIYTCTLCNFNTIIKIPPNLMSTHLIAYRHWSVTSRASPSYAHIAHYSNTILCYIMLCICMYTCS